MQQQETAPAVCTSSVYSAAQMGKAMHARCATARTEAAAFCSAAATAATATYYTDQLVNNAFTMNHKRASVTYVLALQ
jgi:hypothetical protein